MLLFCCFLLAADPPASSISLVDAKAIRIAGLSKESIDHWQASKPTLTQWQSAFRITVADDADSENASLPNVLGTYRTTAAGVEFEPRFPFAPGTPYRVTFDPNVLMKSERPVPLVRKTLVIPKPDAPAVKIVAVYPSIDVLPENTLRMYLHFSGPMSNGDVYRHITLAKADGTPVFKPFIEIDEELWNPTATRLTLLFDPGRIKHGLKSREEAGPNLEAGQTYTLTIAKDWKDANGRPMAESFKKTFRAGPIDNTAVQPNDWKITPPPANGRTPLTIQFPKSLDRSLAERMIRILDPRTKAVEGTVAIAERETKWTFTPVQPWAAGKYSISIDTSLEDICGNRVGSPFEIDVFRPATRRLEAKFVTRDIVIK
jgi:hypothetical protein